MSSSKVNAITSKRKKRKKILTIKLFKILCVLKNASFWHSWYHPILWFNVLSCKFIGIHIIMHINCTVDRWLVCGLGTILSSIGLILVSFMPWIYILHGSNWNDIVLNADMNASCMIEAQKFKCEYNTFMRFLYLCIRAILFEILRRQRGKFHRPLPTYFYFIPSDKFVGSQMEYPYQ